MEQNKTKREQRMDRVSERASERMEKTHTQSFVMPFKIINQRISTQLWMSLTETRKMNDDPIKLTYSLEKKKREEKMNHAHGKKLKLNEMK